MPKVPDDGLVLRRESPAFFGGHPSMTVAIAKFSTSLEWSTFG
jgi:hypothetical protein